MTSNLCLTCSDPRITAIDEALLSGQSASRVARDYELIAHNVMRHKRLGHVSNPHSLTGKMELINPNASATEKLRSLIHYLEGLSTHGLPTSAVLNLAKEKRLAYESLSKMQGPAAPPVFDPSTSAEWIELRGVILAALAPHPAALAALKEAIKYQDE